MSNHSFEYSLRAARSCGAQDTDKQYLDWFVNQSARRVEQASTALARLADGRYEFGESTNNVIRGHVATVNFVEAALTELRDHFSFALDWRMELMQRAMAFIAEDVDSARESFEQLRRFFQGASAA